jgi:hypothetical protein
MLPVLEVKGGHERRITGSSDEAAEIAEPAATSDEAAGGDIAA